MIKKTTTVIIDSNVGKVAADKFAAIFNDFMKDNKARDEKHTYSNDKVTVTIKGSDIEIDGKPGTITVNGVLKYSNVKPKNKVVKGNSITGYHAGRVRKKDG